MNGIISMQHLKDKFKHQKLSIYSKLLVFRHFFRWAGYCVFLDWEITNDSRKLKFQKNKMTNPGLFNDTKPTWFVLFTMSVVPHRSAGRCGTAPWTPASATTCSTCRPATCWTTATPSGHTVRKTQCTLTHLRQRNYIWSIEKATPTPVYWFSLFLCIPDPET